MTCQLDDYLRLWLMRFWQRRLAAPLLPILFMGTLISGCTKQAPTPALPASPAATAVDSAKSPDSFEFELPIRLASAAGPVSVEAPGYASPCWADIDLDGKKDLLVGQFRGGKIRRFKNLGDMKLADGEWLEADGKVAEVPGVW